MSLFEKSVIIKDILIVPEGIDDNSRKRFFFKSKSIKINEFSILHYLVHNEFKANEIRMNEGELSVFPGSGFFFNDSIKEQEFFFNESVSSFFVDKIVFKNFAFNLFRNNIDSTLLIGARNNYLIIEDFKAIRQPDSDANDFSFNKFSIELNNLAFHTKDSLYTTYLKNVTCSYLDSLLVLDSLQIIPAYSKEKFQKEGPQYISRMNLIAPRIVLSGVDFNKYLKYNFLNIKKVNGTLIKMNIYRNDNYPVKEIEKPSIQGLIRDLPIGIAIDSILIIDSQVSYEELSKDAQMSSNIFLSEVNILIRGVNNDTNSYSASSNIKAIVKGRFMSKSELTLNYVFDLNTRAEKFSCSGAMQKVHMNVMNPMFEGSENILIKKGMIDSMSFFFNADQVSAKGSMKFFYRDLEVETFSPANEKEVRTNLKTFIVNKFFIKSDNPGRSGLRIGTIYFPYDPNRYFAYYSRQAIITGINNSIIGNEKAALLTEK